MVVVAVVDLFVGVIGLLESMVSCGDGCGCGCGCGFV